MEVQPGHQGPNGLIIGTYRDTVPRNVPQVLLKAVSVLRTSHGIVTSPRFSSLRIVGPLDYLKACRRRQALGKGMVFCIQGGDGHLAVSRTHEYFLRADCWGYIPPGFLYQFRGENNFSPVTIGLK